MERRRESLAPVQVNNETIIFTEIRDYLNTNRTLKLDEVIPYLTGRFARSSVNINKEGISQVLKSLIEQSLIVEGSKLTRDDILTNVKRNQIYKYIKENPGTYYYQIKKDLNMGSHLVIWHMDILYEFKFVDLIKEDNHEIYFDTEVKPEIAKIQYYVNNKKSKAIIKYLESNDIGVTKTKLATDLNMHPNTIIKYIEILKELKIIESQKESNKILYFLI